MSETAERDGDSGTLLAEVYRGWDGYQASLVKAVSPRTPEELAFRPAPNLNSVAEITRHIAVGRLDWFLRMKPPLGEELADSVPAWRIDPDGNRHPDESAFPLDTAGLVHWLEASWRMIEATLNSWSVGDLERTYRHIYWKQTYIVSNQWTIWRILMHDIQHGGQLTILLYLQGIDIPELGSLGGHLTEPPLAE